MVELKELSFSYPGMARPLFDQLNLSLGSGTICGLLGPNGAGKSTLLKIMAGLIFPQAGSCRVLTRNPAKREPSLLADIFLLPEELHTPVVDALEYEKRFAPFYPRFDHAQFHELLTEFELPHRQKLNTLSQGQRKKFLLAFGLATQSRLLIMDEPTNGLDIPSKSQFRRLLLKHWDSDRSFIISTHQVNDLDGLIDSVAIISKGRILLHENLDDISQRFVMSTEQTIPDDALYYEQTITGYSVVRYNTTSLESRPDLGLLFGLVTSTNSKAAFAASGRGV